MSHGGRCTFGFRMPESSGYESWQRISDLHMPISPKADKQRWPLSTRWPSHLVMFEGGRRSLEREEQLCPRKSRLSQPHTPQEAAMLPPAVAAAIALMPAPRSWHMMARAPAVPTWRLWSAALFPMILGSHLWRKLPQWWLRQLKLLRTDSRDGKLRTCLGDGIWGWGIQRQWGLGNGTSKGDGSLLLCGSFGLRILHGLQVLHLWASVPQPLPPCLENTSEFWRRCEASVSLRILRSIILLLLISFFVNYKT